MRRNDFAKYVLHSLNNEGFKIEWGDILTNVKGSLGRLHIAYALKNKGIVKKVSDAFDLYLNPLKINYNQHYEFDTAEIIKLVKNAGGICSVAHPHTVKNAENLIPKLVKKGLVGIEIIENKKIYNSDNDYMKIGLTKTAGSDFHKNGKNSFIGKNKLTEEEFLSLYSNSKKFLNGKIKWKL